MPSALQKQKLSGSTDGMPIKIVATSGTGTTIHTAVSGTTAGTFDEVYLYVWNSTSAALLVTFQIGGTTSPDQLLAVSVPPTGSSPMLVLDGKILQNSKVITAICASANVCMIDGYVNAITN